VAGFFQKIFGNEPKPLTPVSNSPQPQHPPVQPAQSAQQQPAPEPEKKKKGFWGRLFGGGDDKKDEKKQETPHRQ
jgi:hypothetical protein